MIEIIGYLPGIRNVNHHLTPVACQQALVLEPKLDSSG